jgi:RNA polymerase sigma factor (sigma-70 family)
MNTKTYEDVAVLQHQAQEPLAADLPRLGRDERECVLEELHGQYARKVYGKCERMLGHCGEVEDAVQETFLQAYGSLEKMLRLERNLHLPWLYRVANNVCLHFLRASRKDGGCLDGEVGEELDRVDQTAECDLDLRRKLEQFISEQDERGLEILAAHFSKGMAQAEIALALGITRRAVVKRIAAMRKRLSALCEIEVDEDTGLAPRWICAQSLGLCLSAGRAAI